MSVLTGNFPAEYGRKSRWRRGGDDQSRHPGRISRVGRRGHWQFRHGVRRRIGELMAGAGQALTLSASAARTDRYLDPPVVENYTNDGSPGRRARGLSRPPDRSRSRAVHLAAPAERLRRAQRDRPGGRGAAAGQQPERRRAARRVDARPRSAIACSARAAWSNTFRPALTSNAASTPVIVDQERSFTRGYVNASLAADLGRHQIKFGGDLVVTPVREALAYENYRRRLRRGGHQRRRSSSTTSERATSSRSSSRTRSAADR